MMEDTNMSPFLALPTELRLAIYGFALVEGPVITISAAELVGPHHAIVHRLYQDGQSPYPGLPRDHEPIIEEGYHPDLLSVVDRRTIPVSATDSEQQDTQSGASHDTNPLLPTVSQIQKPYRARYPAHASLLLTNRQINDELTGHLLDTPPAKDPRASNLFIQYPHGLHILRTLAPHLLRQTRSVHIAGIYTPLTFASQHGAEDPFARRRGSAESMKPDSATQLRELIQWTLGPAPRHEIAKLELRVFYPGPNSYQTAWCDERSPIVVALHSISGGHIHLETWRGRHGTGIHLSATTGKECEREKSERHSRVVTTRWGKFGVGEDREVSPWLVDPKWPEWDVRCCVPDEVRGQ